VCPRLVDRGFLSYKEEEKWLVWHAHAAGEGEGGCEEEHFGSL
jgi:hypothetical protein